MKAKVDNVKKTPASKLVDIKKTKADIQKAKKPKAGLKADTVKVAASSVAAPLTFAEKKVLSVKRKAKAAKATPEKKPKGENASVKPKAAKVAKSTTALERPEEPAAQKTIVKKNSPKKAAEGPKQVGEKRKHEKGTVDLKKGKKKVLKQEKAPAAEVASEAKKSPKASAEGAKKNNGKNAAEPAAQKTIVKKNSPKKAAEGPKQVGEKRKHEKGTADLKKGKKKVLKQEKAPVAEVASEAKESPKASAEGDKNVGKKRRTNKKSQEKKNAKNAEKKPQVPREVGPVATEVTEETLALVPKQLISAANFKVMFEHVKKKACEDEKNRLFGDDFKYSLFITGVKIPKFPARNCRVTLPHATMRNDEEACLIVSDLYRGRKLDYNVTVQHWQDKLRALGISSSLQIIPLQQLKCDFAQYEMKRKLVYRFGRFMVDARISGRVFAFLGKQFITRRKNPVPVKLDRELAIKSNIEKALRTETYHQTNKGKQTSIRFAVEWMPVEHAVENGMALIEQLKTIHPGGWLNIWSIHLTSASTDVTSFPLYMSAIDPNLVPVPHLVGPREAFVAKQNAQMLKDTDGKYGITADGLIRKVNPEKNKKTIKREPQSSDPTMETEEGKPAGDDKVEESTVDKQKEEVDEQIEGDDSEGEEEDDDAENYYSQELSSEDDE